MPDMAILLWNSFGTIAAMLNEIVNMYASINPPTLTVNQSFHLCNVLALLKCIAGHPQTRSHFISGLLEYYILPFVQTVNESLQFENLRLISLDIFGALVKVQKTYEYYIVTSLKRVNSLWR